MDEMYHSVDPTCYDGAYSEFAQMEGEQVVYRMAETGVVYHGGMCDGKFSGRGELVLPNCGGKFEASWRDGEVGDATHSRFIFHDGLIYAPAAGESQQWQYCSDRFGDRRIFSEYEQNGGLPPIRRIA
ncbi:MAG: MORN repeat-containing protein 5 [Marteilia pararefringens]